MSYRSSPAPSIMRLPSAVTRLRIALSFAGCALFGLGACTSPGEQGLDVRVTATDGAPVSSFLATVAWNDGRIDNLTCPADSELVPENIRCDGHGFHASGPGRVSEITLRSKANAFASTSVAQSDESAITLTVAPLADAENTPDYATRLDGEQCLDALEDLALRFQSDIGDSYSVKFYIRDLDSEPKVYLQNTSRHPLHFDFARNVLGIPGTADQFAIDTYSGLERRAMGGTLIFYPAVNGSARGATPEVVAPWTLNFFPGDALTAEQLRLAHRLLEERITCLSWTGPARRLVYVPASTVREEDALAEESGFQRAGIGWMSHSQLASGLRMQALNAGVAFGTLVRLTPEQLSTTAVSFRDILLLTRLPNELPLVGGSISEEFQTPLAHVNVAAESRGTPNLAYPEAFQDPAISSRLGKLVRFEVAGGAFTLDDATLEEAEAFWAERMPEPYVPSFDVSASGIPEFAEVGFDDSSSIGAKAANLAELSHVLGENAPRQGLAIPFRYYDEHMRSSWTSSDLCAAAENDCVGHGREPATCQRARELCMPADTPETLADFVERVIGDANFRRDTALRDAVLASLRYAIESTEVSRDFAELLDARVAEIFQDAKVKLRSSTNAEDLLGFSGAGLYNSYAAHASGASAVSRVVTRVFASVWSFRAFEERSFWNIEHTAVRMGCAINQAFSDELANGVLITQNIADPTVYGMYVNVQQGEASVTNPEEGALPEIFSILADTSYQVVRQRFSSLSPERPILSSDEIQSLYDAGDVARAHFAKLYGTDVTLDIEFKLTPEHKIVFKQARPYVSR